MNTNNTTRCAAAVLDYHDDHFCETCRDLRIAALSDSELNVMMARAWDSNDGENILLLRSEIKRRAA
jgi:hypothetical protein